MCEHSWIIKASVNSAASFYPASLFGSIQISQCKATWSSKSLNVELEETTEAPEWMLARPPL